MKKVTYISKALAVLFITAILVISGCKNKTSSTPDSNTASPTTAVNNTGRRPLNKLLSLMKLADANEVAVTVNGVEIKESAVQELIKPQIDQAKQDLQNPNVSLPDEDRVMEGMKEIWQTAVMQLVREELLEEQVKDANIVVSNEEADEFFKKRLEEAGVDLENFKKVLEEKKVSYDEILADAKKELTYINFILSKMDASEKVTIEDVNEFYVKNKSRFTVPEQVKASHILVPASKDEPNDVREKAKAKINDMLRQIKEGADFAEFAKNNPDSTSATGGDLGYFTKGEMLEDFEKAAFALEPNQVSDVIETIYGYHLIKVTDHKDEEIVSFDEVKDKLLESLNNQKENEFIEQYIDSLVKNADIKFPKGKEIKIQAAE